MEASFELETRVSSLVSRHSTMPACPASTWGEGGERGGRRERREERGERREEGRGNIAQEGIVVHGPHSHLAVLALPVEHLDLFTVCGYSQEILTLPHKLHI